MIDTKSEVMYQLGVLSGVISGTAQKQKYEVFGVTGVLIKPEQLLAWAGTILQIGSALARIDADHAKNSQA